MLFIWVYLEEINELLMRLRADVRVDANEIMNFSQLRLHF